MVAMTQDSEIKIFSSPEALFEAAAKDFMNRSVAAVNEKGIFSVVLSGGNTPKLFFDMLTNREYCKKIPWNKIQFFFGDERYVSSEDLENNFHMANKYLFSKVPVNDENIYPIPTDLRDPKATAKLYAETLRTAFHIKDEAFPLFDLVYLGLGENAHTASLMPFIELDKNKSLVASVWVPELNMYRITLTPDAINNSQNIIFLVMGKNKEMAVWNVFKGPTNPKKYPAQLIHCQHGKTFWYLDQLSAGKLNP